MYHLSLHEVYISNKLTLYSLTLKLCCKICRPIKDEVHIKVIIRLVNASFLYLICAYTERTIREKENWFQRK